MGCAKTTRCQNCIKISMVVLIVFILVQILLAILKGVFTKNIFTADVIQTLLKTFMTEQDIQTLGSAFSLIAFAISIITIAGVICAAMTLCVGRFCNQKCGGCMTKCFVFLNFAVFLAIAIVFFLAGSTLTVVKTSFNEEFVREQCQNAIVQQYD